MIEVRDARLALAGAAALAGASLRLDRGEVVAVAGANGSGKSTLGRLIAGGLIADAGSVHVDGIDPAESAASRARVRRLVGVVGQDPHDQIVAMTVGEEVAFGPRNLGLAEGEIAARVSGALELAGLPGREGEQVSALSGGELVRVALAGILAMRPAYLVLDETGAMLDRGARDRLRSLARSLAHTGAGVLVITHDPVDIAAADRVAVLESGTVAWDGPPRALVEGERGLWDRVTGDDDLARAVADRLRAVRTGGRGSLASGAGAGGPRSDVPTARPRPAGASDAPDSPGAVRAPVGAVCGAEAGAGPSAGAPAARITGSDAVPPRPRAAFPAPGPLVLAGVGYTYPGASRPALDRIDLTVSPGEILLLAGVSGSGKSTLAALAAGLIAPSAGTVRRGGLPVRPGEVGLAAQRPEDQIFLDRVDDEIAFGPRSLGVAEGEVARRVRDAMAAVGLDRGLADRHPLELSGGQRRRVGTASVLALEPGACIFDEPTAGLDAPGRAEVRRMARRLAAAGAPVLVISHDIDEWLADADALALIEGGSLVWSGPRGEATAHPGVWARAGLVLPVAFGGAIELPPRAGEGALPQPAAPPSGGRAAGLPAFRHPDTGALPGEATPVRTARPAPVRAGAPHRAAPERRPLDARVKLLLFLAAAVALFASPSPLAIGGGALALALSWAASRRTGGGASARPRPAPAPGPRRPPALPLLALAGFVLAANLVSCDGTARLVLVGPVGLDPASALTAAFALARLAILLGLALVIASTVSVSELAAAFVRLLSPLAALRVPAAALSASLSIALTSIPGVVDEFRRIELSQRARGAKLDEGPLAARIRLRAAIVVPVVLALLRRADRLGEAMAARSFDPDVIQVPPRPLPLRDTMVLVAGLIAASLLIALAAIV